MTHAVCSEYVPNTLYQCVCAYCIDGGSSAAVLSVQSTVEAADSFLVLNPTHTHNDPYHGCMQYSLSPVALSPSSITNPCVTSALSVAMTPALSIITRSSLTSCVASTADSKELQSKVSCPNSLQCRPVNTVTVKYNRAEDSKVMGREGVMEDGDRATGERLYCMQP